MPLTQKKLLRNTPRAVKNRSRFCTIRPKRKGRFVDDEKFGNVFQLDYIVKCLDGNRRVTLKYVGKHKPGLNKEDRLSGYPNPNSEIWLTCDCPYHKFFVEYALAKYDSSDIIYSNGDPPVIKNPTELAYCCKHSLLALETAIKEYGHPGKLQDVLKNVRLESPPAMLKEPKKKVKKLIPDSTLQKLHRDLDRAYELDDFAAFDRLRRAIDRIKKNPKFDKVTEISKEIARKLPKKPRSEEKERLVPIDQLDRAKAELGVIENTLQESEGKPPISKSVIDRLNRDLQSSEKSDDFAAFDRLRRAIDRIRKNPKFKGISENIRRMPTKTKRKETSLVPKNQLDRIKRDLSVIEDINEKDIG